MFFLIQKILETSMRLTKRKSRFAGPAGRFLGIFPMWYAERMEKKLMKGNWNPGKKWRKKSDRKKRG